MYIILKYFHTKKKEYYYHVSRILCDHPREGSPEKDLSVTDVLSTLDSSEDLFISQIF